MPELVKKLPKNPKKGSKYDMIVKNPKSGRRRITFKATGKIGFGKWKFTANKKA